LAAKHFTHGHKGRVWDTQGHEYVDLILGYGPVILGHGHPEVTRAVYAQGERGTLLPGPTPLQARLEDLVRRAYPRAERQLLFKTGSEAVAAAIRIARAATGRTMIARVGFHGWHDQVISPYLSCHAYARGSETAEYPLGVPHDAVAGRVEAWTGDAIGRVPALVSERGSDLAAVIIDPVQLAPPFAEAAAAIATACRETGALLILDESKTGFRIAPGGFQDLYGVAGDLTVLSKAIANGYPLAVLAGCEDVMALAKPARIKGTYAAELSAVAAAVATLEVLEREGAAAQIAARGQGLLERLNEVITAEGPVGLAAVAYHWPSMPYLFFAPGTPAAVIRDSFYEKLADANVLMLRDHMGFVSLAHTDEDVERVAVAVLGVLRALQ
jgi:glutamate-1-semialdehyde 2,1-aminomutase